MFTVFSYIKFIKKIMGKCCFSLDWTQKEHCKNLLLPDPKSKLSEKCAHFVKTILLPFSNNYFETAYNSWITVTFQSGTSSNTFKHQKDQMPAMLFFKWATCQCSFLRSKILQINSWTNKINKNLYNKHCLTKNLTILNMFI